MKSAVVSLTLFLLALSSFAQTLNVPARATNALSGQQFVGVISPPMLTPPDLERENWIYSQILSGNVPNFQRSMVQITTNAIIGGVNHTVSYYVTPEYSCIGSDSDYFIEPMTPLLAQRVSTLLNCTLPTRKMVNDISAKAAVHLQPNPIPPSPDMITVPVFNTHNTMVETQRVVTLAAHPLGALVDGDQKDVIISTLIYNNLHSGVPKPVVIYGWHYPDGTFIQPAYNGHEETYADYSHGIRMVQQAITVDGTNTTVSAVLTNPALAALLSDETTFTGNVISQPYYTVAAVAPIVLSSPGNRTIKQGGSALFPVTCAGDPPLKFFWRLNGSNIAGATNQTFSLTNAQTANAGTYTVLISNAVGTATSSAAVVQVTTNAFPLLFSDDFDTNSSANWNFYWGAQTGSSADYTVDWAYDYGGTRYTFNGVTRLIPPSPNSTGSTKGVKFTVNDTNGINLGVNIYPKNKSFSNNYALKFDLWINYPGAAGGSGSTGSTQYPIFGINHLGTQLNWAATSASSSDGLWFANDGDGGTTRDYRAYVGNLAGVETELIGATSGLSQSNHAASIFTTLFPSPPSETLGAPGKTWVSVEVNQTNGVINWKLNGTTVAQRANTTVFTNGTIMLGLMDVFPSIASPLADSFVIFDNVRVENQSAALVNCAVITTNPTNQTVAADGTATFNVAASGAGPLSYQWFLNGTAVAGQTAATCALSNVQAANAGSYYALVSNPAGSVFSTVATLTVTNAAPTFLFSDNFDTDTSTNWNFFWAAQSGSVADYTVNWAFDYGSTHYTSNGVSLLIPPSPNSTGTTKGVKFTVNNTAGVNLGVNIYPKNKLFSNNYALKFDMWLNYPGNAGGAGASGTTQFAISGIDHTGTEVNWAATNSAPTDGIWFAVDGEGGTSRDYRAYIGNPAGVETELIGTAASGITSADNAVAPNPSLFPAPPFETSGAPGKAWVAVEINQSNHIVTWKFNGTVVAQRTNTTVFTNGTIMLGLMDVFPSLASPAADCFVIFDNVRVSDLGGSGGGNLTQQPGGGTNSSLASPQIVGQNFQFNLAGGSSNSYYLIETSSNLFDWAPFQTNTPPAQIMDPAGLTFPARYYRARLVP